MYLPPTPALTFTLARAPQGNAGAFHTLAHMRRLVNEWKTSNAILSAAISLVFLQPEKDGFAEINTIFSFVRDGIRYTQDVLGVETLASPLVTLNRKVGDCDDKATLFATLAESIGYPTRFVITGYFGSKNYEHVHCQVYFDGEWVDADTTESQPLGYSPPNPTLIFVERI